MRKIVFTLMVLMFCITYGQTLKVKYKHQVINKGVNKVFEFPAVLSINGENTLYKVKYGIDEQKYQNKVDNGNEFSIYEKGSYYHQLYSKGDGVYLIKDKINGKEYFFRDKLKPLKYKILNEKKEINGKPLTKAVAKFRGRLYFIWFDASSKIKKGPWKFNNLPGLAYVIYDKEEKFRWILEGVEEDNSSIENPFTDFKGEIISYEKYPKLKYALSEKLKENLKKHGINMTEQERDGLELIFESER